MLEAPGPLVLGVDRDCVKLWPILLEPQEIFLLLTGFLAAFFVAMGYVAVDWYSWWDFNFILSCARGLFSYLENLLGVKSIKFLSSYSI